MENGFDKDEFMKWLKDEFPGIIDIQWNYDLVENIIEYGFKYEMISKDRFCYWLSDMLPEVEFLEVAKFCADGYLTNGTLEQLKRK